MTNISPLQAFTKDSLEEIFLPDSFDTFLSQVLPFIFPSVVSLINQLI